ncbi:MAG: hypothetical protein R3E63_03645 [Pseudomonadales bacterium]
MSLLLLFAVNEYEKDMAFQWESMVQPHWEGAVPQEKLLLPLVNDQAKEIVITPEEKEIEQPPVVDVEKVVVETKPAPVKAIVKAIKKIGASHPAAKPAMKNESTAKMASNQRRALRLRMSDDNLYRNQTARWEEKKKKVMPDFFAPKEEPNDGIEMGAQLIMDDDDRRLGGSKKKQDEDAGYLDSIQGAEFNFKIKMR